MRRRLVVGCGGLCRRVDDDSGGTDDEKRQQATTFLDRQLEQLEKQVKQAEQASKVTINQKRFAGTYGAIVLIVALTLLCLGSVL